METNSFTRLELHTPISNLKLKNGLLSEPFILIWGVHQGSTLSYCYVTLAEVPAIFTDADTRVNGVQIGDHKIKQ